MGTEARSQLGLLCTYFLSTIGSKKVMALTGLGWVGFVVSHMLGNLLIFLGPEAYNSYSHALITNKLLIIAELGLVGMLSLHILYGVSLSLRNKKARPQSYAVKSYGEKAPPANSQTMIYHGVVLLVFIILHLVTFKYGPHYTATYNGVVMRDLFRLIIEVFQNPYYVAGYIVALFCLGFHLSHGVRSSLQSLGLNNGKYASFESAFSWGVALVAMIGFLSQPIYVYLVYS